MSSVAEQQRIEFFLKKINELPAFPGVVAELLRLLGNPLSSSDQIERILSTDSALTLKTLRLANSAYYSVPGGAKTLKRAITYLGMSSLKQIVMTSAVFGQFEGQAVTFDQDKFWKHSMCTAAVAEMLSRHFDLGNPQDAFIGGLVHDIGKLIYNIYDREEYTRIEFLAKFKSIAYEDAEKELSSVKHGIIGAMVAKTWNLPAPIQSAIRDHHSPGLATRLSTVPEVVEIVDAVYLANRIVANWSTPKEQEAGLKAFAQDEVLRRNEIKIEAFEKLGPQIEKALTSANALYQTLVSR
jgi:putative nucleotidyltransferase with HDIG domain